MAKKPKPEKPKPRDLEAIFDALMLRLTQDEIDAIRMFARLKL